MFALFQILLNFATANGFAPDEFKVISSFPRRDVSFRVKIISWNLITRGTEKSDQSSNLMFCKNFCHVLIEPPDYKLRSRLGNFFMTRNFLFSAHVSWSRRDIEISEALPSGNFDAWRAIRWNVFYAALLFLLHQSLHVSLSEGFFAWIKSNFWNKIKNKKKKKKLLNFTLFMLFIGIKNIFFVFRWKIQIDWETWN